MLNFRVASMEKYLFSTKEEFIASDQIAWPTYFEFGCSDCSHRCLSLLIPNPLTVNQAIKSPQQR